MLIVAGNIKNENMIRRIPTNNFFTPFAPKHTKKTYIENVSMKSHIKYLSFIQNSPKFMKKLENSSSFTSIPKLPSAINVPNKSQKEFLSVIDLSVNTTRFFSVRKENQIVNSRKNSISMKNKNFQDQRIEPDEIYKKTTQNRKILNKHQKNLNENQKKLNEDLKRLYENRKTSLSKIIERNSEIKAVKNVPITSKVPDTCNKGSRQFSKSILKLHKHSINKKQHFSVENIRSLSAHQEKDLQKIDFDVNEISGW